jgi:ABC-2 type transport system ATP-binding protein
MTEPLLQFRGVTRRFGHRTAVRDLDLDVHPGEVVGLVGRNGAGKTTSLRLTVGILWPDAGAVRTLGLDPVHDGDAVRVRACLMAEDGGLYPSMTVRESMDLVAGVHPRWDGGFAEAFRERMDLDPGRTIRDLSRGNRAKVALTLAVGCRPELLLLDDPTAGLDPLVRREVLEGVLEATAGEGGAVLYASHLVHDVERTADRVVVLDDARKVLDEPVDSVRARVRRVTAVFPEAAPDSGNGVPGLLHAEADGRTLSLAVMAPEGDVRGALIRMGAAAIEVEPMNLEDVLVALLRRGPVPSGVPSAPSEVER